TSSPSYLLSFVRSNELFGGFPIQALAPDRAGVRLFDTLAGKDTTPTDTSDVFSGIVRETVSRVDNTLVFLLDFNRPIAKQADIYIYCFGYRKDRPFRDMPKIQVRLGLLKSGLYDQRKKRPFDAIGVTRTPRTIKVVIPLSLLGDPHYIMTSSASYLGEVPLDRPAWYTLSLAP
ncbi:MAG: hypothetical protein KKF80_05995, partial [Candidatus Omnitrophica bacterium]|nr:hypothetical protein [Candidatus Omnitrophota bacterium]